MPTPQRVKTASAHSHAVRVYSLPVTELIRPNVRLSGVRHVGWRYFWKDLKACPSVEVMLALLDRRHVASSRSVGPVNRRILQSLQRAEKQTLRNRHSFRLLSVPPLVLSAIWLKTHRHTKDQVIPIETIVSQLQPLETYSMGRFLEYLRLEAARLLESSRTLGQRKKGRSASKGLRQSASPS